VVEEKDKDSACLTKHCSMNMCPGAGTWHPALLISALHGDSFILQPFYSSE